MKRDRYDKYSQMRFEMTCQPVQRRHEVKPRNTTAEVESRIQRLKQIANIDSTPKPTPMKDSLFFTQEKNNSAHKRNDELKAQLQSLTYSQQTVVAELMEQMKQFKAHSESEIVKIQSQFQGPKKTPTELEKMDKQLAEKQAQLQRQNDRLRSQLQQEQEQFDGQMEEIGKSYEQKIKQLEGKLRKSSQKIMQIQNNFNPDTILLKLMGNPKVQEALRARQNQFSDSERKELERLEELVSGLTQENEQLDEELAGYDQKIAEIKARFQESKKDKAKILMEQKQLSEALLNALTFLKQKYPNFK